MPPITAASPLLTWTSAVAVLVEMIGTVVLVPGCAGDCPVCVESAGLIFKSIIPPFRILPTRSIVRPVVKVYGVVVACTLAVAAVCRNIVCWVTLLI